MKILKYARIVSRHSRDVEWWTGTALPLLRNKTISAIHRPFLDEPVPVMDEDWDNLVILDACRFDMFEEVYRSYLEDGTLESRVSVGSTTPEFVEGNFSDEQFHETVYVTANPIYRHDQRYGTDHRCDFYEIVDVWLDDWNEELKTVHPADVTQRAIEAHDDFPNKRLIVHYMKPHFPFIGEFGQTIDHGGIDVGRSVALGNDTSREEETIWNRIAKGEVSTKTARRAYTENLELVLEHVSELLNSIGGTTVVTSDHGNFVGEFGWPYPARFYGHPKQLHHPILVKVPWFRKERRQRREIQADVPHEPTDVTSDIVADRLEQLGYRSD